MKVWILSALILLDAVLAGVIILMSAFSEPESPRNAEAVVPVAAPIALTTSQSVSEQPTPAETTMFGSGGISEKKPVDVAPTTSSRPDAGDIFLLGVLIAQQEGGRQAVVSLLRHGSPSIVSRLALGGTLDGWKLTSATRTTVSMSRGDGTTRILQVGAGAKDKAPR